MKYKKFGYVQISSKDQDEEQQIQNMKNLGIEERDIFIDKQSDQNMKRENYQILKRLVRTGDTIVLNSLKRLGESMNDVLEEFRYYEKYQVNLQFIKEPFINVKYITNDDIHSTIQKDTLRILSILAEKERYDIERGQAEGVDLG
ncbi:integrase [Bacillus thuringiensis]|nr:integrase [Bacillus thuringiensis]PFD38586.1 integrase [Bacillus thuringiensis]PFE60506.1 integrase [Bacillus thuringiensis]PFI31126.1 integrase [Bacillus thuringiensis]PGQ26434.1 integrase [Bacillus thuringiensis]